jgi:hypothetical protein
MKSFPVFVPLLLSLNAGAGQVDIIAVESVQTSTDVYRFDVTLRHADTGWDHYADGWEVLTIEGKPLAERILYHPHVDEQPFTRSLSGVRIPPGETKVIIRARDKVHGYTQGRFSLGSND